MKMRNTHCKRNFRRGLLGIVLGMCMGVASAASATEELVLETQGTRATQEERGEQAGAYAPQGLPEGSQNITQPGKEAIGTEKADPRGQAGVAGSGAQFAFGEVAQDGQDGQIADAPEGEHNPEELLVGEDMQEISVGLSTQAGAQKPQDAQERQDVQNVQDVQDSQDTQGAQDLRDVQNVQDLQESQDTQGAQDSRDTQNEQDVTGNLEFSQGNLGAAQDDPELAQGNLGFPESQFGTCSLDGASVFWQIQDGTLAISGMGEMQEWERAEDVPWHAYRLEVTQILVEEGVQSIGAYAFSNCANVTDLQIAESVANIGAFAFFGCGGLTSVSLG